MWWINMRVNTAVTLLLPHPHCFPYAGEERQLSRGEHSQAVCGEHTLHSLTQPSVFLWSPTGSFYVLLHQRGLKVRETHVGLLSGPKEGAQSGVAAEEWWRASKKRDTSAVELGNNPLGGTGSAKVLLGSVQQHWRDLLPHSSTANLEIIVLGARALNLKKKRFAHFHYNT